MPKASNATATETVAIEGVEGHYQKLDGGYTVGFETYFEDSDPADLFRGRSSTRTPR
jgi:hypothetical protein